MFLVTVLIKGVAILFTENLSETFQIDYEIVMMIILNLDFFRYLNSFRNPTFFNSQFNRKNYRKLVITPNLALEDIALFSGIVFVAITLKNDMHELKNDMHELKYDMHELKSMIKHNGGEIASVNNTMVDIQTMIKHNAEKIVSLNNTMVDNFRYLKVDSGYTIELSIRNSLAAKYDLEFSQRVVLDSIYALVSMIPLDQKFGTEKDIAESILLNFRQRKLPEFCVVSIYQLKKHAPNYNYYTVLYLTYLMLQFNISGFSSAHYILHS